jgi:hypothetical protein
MESMGMFGAQYLAVLINKVSTNVKQYFINKGIYIDMASNEK